MTSDANLAKTRKVQKLGSSTLAVTLPLTWAREYGVDKGDEVVLQESSNGVITVTPGDRGAEESSATIHADELPGVGVERAVLAQYALGRNVIRIAAEEPLTTEQIDAVYAAETQLMGLGLIEETPTTITIRCSVDPKDFTLASLIERLESTGRTMRQEAIRALAEGDEATARRAINREKQANKIFVLLLRLIFSAHRNPSLGEHLGVDGRAGLIGYRSVAKNLELTADSAEDAAVAALDVRETFGADSETVEAIRGLADAIDEITRRAVEALVDEDYEAAVDVRRSYRGIVDREREILEDLPDVTNDELLQVRELLVALRQSAEYAVRNAEIASNVALDRDSDHVTIVD